MHQLLKPKWLAGHILALGLVVLFINLGFWQVRRLQTRRSYNAQLAAYQAETPERYDVLTQTVPEAELSYRPVVLAGVFDDAEDVRLRSRSLNGQPGYHLLTPFVFEEGRALLINRGWIPFDANTFSASDIEPPSGEVLVAGILYPSEQPPEDFSVQDPATGKLDAVFFIDTTRLEQQLPYSLEPHYLRLTDQRPAPNTYPVILGPEELTEGSHLNYAFQWFSFATIGIVGYVLLLRSVLKEDDDDEMRLEQLSTPSAQA
ncbi:MAG: SURF1 family protein [Deinococcota bacterium]